MENKDAYLRVVTIFTIFLSNTTNTHGSVFIAHYNPKTKEVLQCDLLWLLIRAYNQLPVYGTFYILPHRVILDDEYKQTYNRSKVQYAVVNSDSDDDVLFNDVSDSDSENHINII
jgi:hypothetical protein